MNGWIELNCINQTQPATRRTHKQRRRRRTMENQQRMPTRVTLPINAAIQQTSFLSWCCVTLFALERCWVRFCGHHIALLWSCSFGFSPFSRLPLWRCAARYFHVCVMWNLAGSAHFRYEKNWPLLLPSENSHTELVN